MDQIAKKLIFTGVIVCLIGSVFAVSGIYLAGWIEDSIDRNLVAGIWFIKVIIAAVQYGVAPFGAALAALGVAVHWVGGSAFLNSPGKNDQRGASSDRN